MIAEKYFDLEIEKTILGCIFLNNDLMEEIKIEITPYYFSNEKNRFIFECMEELHKDGKDIDYLTMITIIKEKKKQGFVRVEYLSELAELVPSSANYRTYLDILIELFQKRELEKAIEETKQMLDSKKAVECIEQFNEKIKKGSQKSNKERSRSIAICSDEFYTHTNNVQSGKIRSGLKTGFQRLDEITNGLEKDELIILGARPAMGKSALAINLANNVAEINNANVIIFSLEMSERQIMCRMFSSIGMIPQDTLKNPKMTSRDWRAFECAKKTLQARKIYINDTCDIKVSEIGFECKKIKEKYGLNLVIIDYLQLIKGNGKSRVEEVGNISRNLKLLAKDLSIPVVVLAQLSRNLETREDKTPQLADLRESGSIEQDADIVMFLYREDYYRRGSEIKDSKALLKIAKNRSGNIGEVDLIWLPSYSLFKEK